MAPWEKDTVFQLIRHQLSPSVAMYLVSRGQKTPQTNSIDLSCTHCSSGEKQHHLESSDESEVDAPVSIMQQSVKMTNLSSAFATPTGHTTHSTVNLNLMTRDSGGASVSDLSSLHMHNSAHNLSSIMTEQNSSLLTISSSNIEAVRIGQWQKHTKPHHQEAGIFNLYNTIESSSVINGWDRIEKSCAISAS